MRPILLLHPRAMRPSAAATTPQLTLGEEPPVILQRVLWRKNLSRPDSVARKRNEDDHQMRKDERNHYNRRADARRYLHVPRLNHSALSPSLARKSVFALPVEP